MTSTPKADAKIGMWGAARGGKTTFLSALEIAANRSEGAWSVGGEDRLEGGSTQFFVRGARFLRAGAFPPATVGKPDADPFPYAAKIKGKVEGGWRDRKVEATLRFDDRAGSDFLKYQHHLHALWQDLASCNALIYVFDPDLVRRRPAVQRPTQQFVTPPGFDDADDEPDPVNYDYLMSVVSFMKQNCKLEKGGFLPHHLAVCLTKFDKRWVFKRLLDQGLIDPQLDTQTGGFESVPSVPKENARRAFERFASGELLSVLDSSFHEKKVEFFVMSAIGFARTPEGGVKYDEISNGEFDPVSGEEINEIPEDLWPINVLAPLEWIFEKLS